MKDEKVMKTIGFNLDNETVETIDSIVEEDIRFHNRTHFIKIAINEFIDDYLDE